MNQYELNTGAKIPLIGFGTWQMRGGQARRAVEAALQTGYRLIDTARIYMNERNVGAAIRASGIRRDDIFVTTKLWNSSHGRRRARAAFHKSLRRLGLDYVDLYLVHWPVSGKREETWRVLEEVHRSGQARAIGVSNYTVRHLKELLANTGTVPAVNQVEFHPFLYREQIELLDFCKRHKIIVEAYSPLAHGHRMDDPVLERIAGSHHKSVPQIMLRWALQHGTVPIPKSTHPERIRENFEIFDFELSDKEMSSVNGLSDGLRTCWNPKDIA